MIRIYDQENTEMANKYMKRCSTSLISRKMQNTPSHLLETIFSKTQEILSVGKDVEKRELLCTVDGNVS